MCVSVYAYAYITRTQLSLSLTKIGLQLSLLEPKWNLPYHFQCRHSISNFMKLPVVGKWYTYMHRRTSPSF